MIKEIKKTKWKIQRWQLDPIISSPYWKPEKAHHEHSTNTTRHRIGSGLDGIQLGGGGRRRRKSVDDNGNLHSAKTATVSTNEVISLGFVQRYKILPAAPVSHCTFRCTVIVSGLVHFKHIVLRFLIPKRCAKQREYYSYYDFSKKRKKRKKGD